MSRNERAAERRRRRSVLGVSTAAGTALAAALTTLASVPTAGADPAAAGVTADQFSDLLTGEGTPADNAVDNFYQGIANFFAPEAVGNGVTADQFSDLLTGEGTPADNAVDNFYQVIADFFAPEALGKAATAALPGDGDGITISNPPGPDADFLSGPLQTFGPFTMQGFADPDEHFDVAIMSIPSLGITDVLTSGIDPSDHLALADPGLGLPADVTAGTVDVTVNTLTDTMNPGLDSSFTIPFTDPLTELWVALLPLGA
jgi:hypothetical protein